MLRKTSITLIILVLFFLLSMVSTAKALTINASSLFPPWTFNTNYWTGTETSQPQINAAIALYIGSALELYKQDYGSGESGSLAGAYTTTFPLPLVSNATISWDGPAYISPPSYLLVKDGNQTPAWYLFNLNIIPWNGMDTIYLTNFWTGQGAISHVTLYGSVAVPEPGILILLGIAMSAVGIASRYVRKI